MKIIGLCGQSGSGKSSVCEMLLRKGIPTLNTDNLYHDLIIDPHSLCTRALTEAFGASILSANGSINRVALRELVFGAENKEKLLLLNSISHAYVKQETEIWIQKKKEQNFDYVCLDVPLLFESKMNLMCSITVAVISSHEKQIERIVARDGVSVEDARKRLFAQVSNEKLKTLCDCIILNNGSLEDLEKQVEMFLEKIIFKVR